MSSDSGLAVVSPSSIQEDNVGTLMRRATDVAGVCGAIVKSTAVNIQGRKYVRVEGWQSIAVAYGCIASARDIEKVPGGIRAIGEVRRMSDGAVLAIAEGFVGDDELTWAGGTDAKGKVYPARAEYAKRAMAQTRAISRVCRSAFAFVVTLIDEKMSTTPYEEMADVVDSEAVKAAAPIGAAALKAQLAPNPAAPSPPKAARRLVVDANEPPHSADSEPAPSQEERAHDGNATFGFGKSKGVPISQVDPKSLAWYRSCLQKDLADESKSQWHAKTAQQLANLEAELRWRGL
jgi:hypothetical protein